MARHKFTEQWVRSRVAPPDTRLEYADQALPGFRLRVSGPDVRTFSAVVRTGGRLRRYTIGRHPRWSLAAARQEAMRLMRAADAAAATYAEPIAPTVSPVSTPVPIAAIPIAPAPAVPVLSQASIEHRTDEPAAPPPLTYAAMVDAYEELHLRPNTRSWKNIARDARHPALAHLMDRPAEGIARRELVVALDAIVRAGHPQAAASVHRHAAMAFRWAWDRDMIAANPTERIKRPAPAVERDRVLADAELAAVWQGTFGLQDPYGQLVRLLVLLGQRRTETASMRWGHLVKTADGPEWHIPRSKNGRPHVVPLPPLAIATLARLPHGADDAFVFSTDGGATHFSSYSRRKSELDTAAPGIAPWRFHDLRRTCRSGLARLGVPREICRKIVGHSEGVIDRIYDRYDAMPARRAGLVQWQAHIEGIALVAHS